jgi:hypothetical protein|tara:strand:- start:338 stop:772 length:435 start_codon:yes stop_codon:yes gene_type:complete
LIIPDVNLLLYAYDAESPFHARATSWWLACLAGTEPVGLAHVVMFGFMRVSTSARAFRNPLGASEAAGHIRAWLEQPVTEVVLPGPGHTGHVLQLLDELGTAANLVTDAQIAAIAIEHDAVVHTSDADFTRFPGVRWLNPVAAA